MPRSDSVGLHVHTCIGKDTIQLRLVHESFANWKPNLCVTENCVIDTAEETGINLIIKLSLVTKSQLLLPIVQDEIDSR